MPTADEKHIGEMLITWRKAIADGDRKGILAHHTKDMLMYDFPSTVRGIEAYDNTWKFFDNSRQARFTAKGRRPDRSTFG